MHGDEPADDAELRALTVSAGSSALAVELQRLLDLSVAAIPTCMGVSLILRSDAPVVTVSALRRGWADRVVMASMSVGIPRPLTWPSDAEAELVLYAVTRHAFQDAAPSVLALLDMRSRQLTLDAHLHAPNLAEERAGILRWLDQQRVVDRAIGILLEQGLLPEEGRLQLARLADLDGTSRFEAAQALIESTTSGSGD